MEVRLFLVVLDFDGLEVFSLEDLAAFQAFDVFDALAAGNHLGTGMVASGLHKQRLDEVYFNRLTGVVKPPSLVLRERYNSSSMPFPIHRLRRLRATEALRGLVRETRLHPGQFILPLFVCPGEGIRREIGAMPGNYQMSIDEIVKECEEVRSLGISGVILFGLPEIEGRDGVGRVRRQRHRAARHPRDPRKFPAC